MLFAELWLLLKGQAGDILAGAWLGRGAAEYSALLEHLRECRAVEVPTVIREYCDGRDIGVRCDVAPDDALGRKFVVICALDEAAGYIHPASKSRIPGFSRGLYPLLEAMKAERTAADCYAKVPEGTVIPKGQLTVYRDAEEAETASGVNFSAQFQFLTFVATLEPPYQVEYRVYTPSQFGGAGPASLIGIAPIAEDKDDLEFVSTAQGAHPFLDAKPASVVDLGQRLINAVVTLLDQDTKIIVLPELISSSNAVSELVKVLKRRPPSLSSTLIVCGSGLSTEKCSTTGKPYNEAIVLDERGEVLFSQHKVHLFNMNAERMKECLIPFATGCDGRNHLEDVASGKRLFVCDFQGIGRVMILICEDLEQAKITGETVFDVRPDWILTPVLDVKQKLGRWTHQRAIEIGRRTLSRIVISSSATLTVRQTSHTQLRDLDPSDVGLALVYDGYEGRRVRCVVATELTTSPVCVLVPWESNSWDRDNVGSAPS